MKSANNSVDGINDINNIQNTNETMCQIYYYLLVT